MPKAVISFKIDQDGAQRTVRLAHITFAETQAEADAEMAGHADICPKFGPAFRKGETVEFIREIEELPPADPDELEAWLDAFLAELGDDLDDVDDDDDDEDDEG